MAQTSKRAKPPTTNRRGRGKVTGEESSHGTPVAPRSAAEHGKRHGFLGYLQLLGPGLVTGASDDDPSGIATYSQVGSQFGFAQLWTAVFTFPLMVAVQELCARIALQTGVGLGTALKRRFPTWVVGIAVAVLLVANTINAGADLSGVAAGLQLIGLQKVPAAVIVVVVAAVIMALQLLTTYTVIFKLFKFLTLALFAYVLTAFVVHPALRDVFLGALVPHITFSGPFIAGLVAIFGTTISPYLFFWQASSEVDEMKAAGMKTEDERRGVSRKELKSARADILTGMAFSQIVMFCIIVTSGATLNAHGLTNVASAQQAAEALRPLAGSFASLLFAAGIVGTGMLAIPILTASGAYALKELTGMRGGLDKKPKQAPTFYAVVVASMLIGVAMNLLHINPISALFVTAVINGIAAPPLLFLIILTGSDRRIMRERVAGKLSKAGVWAAFAVMSLAVVGLILTTWGPLSG